MKGIEWKNWKKLLEDNPLLSKTVFVIAILLLAFLIFFPDKEKADTDFSMEADTDTEPADYTHEMERKLEVLLENIEGAGKVKVMLTLKESKEIVLAEDKKKTEEITEETDSVGGSRKTQRFSLDTQIIYEDGQPFVLKNREPKVEGVVVVAEGANSSRVVSEIHSAIMALFDVPSHKIQVLRKGSES